MIRKFWKYLIILSKAKFSWRYPKKSSILIYDATGVYNFWKYVEKWDPQVLNIRGEKVNLKILFSILFQPGRLFNAYVDKYIEHVNPNFIITYIDNSKFFYTLSNRHKSIKTIFIQNGLRSYYGDIFDTLDTLDRSELEIFKVDYMFTFGGGIGDHYLKYISGLVIPVGSLINNSIERKVQSQKDVMVYISQFVPHDMSINGELYNIEKFAGQMERPILKALHSYADLHKKKFMIIPRTSKNSSNRILEENYFNNLLHHKTNFIDLDEDFSSYDACDFAEVVIAIDTTLAYESIARGNKTAVFSVRGNVFDLKGYGFGWPKNYPDRGSFWTNQLDLNAFNEILDYLFKADKVTWEDDLSKIDFPSIMEYDRGNLNLQATLNKIIDLK